MGRWVIAEIQKKFKFVHVFIEIFGFNSVQKRASIFVSDTNPFLVPWSHFIVLKMVQSKFWKVQFGLSHLMFGTEKQTEHNFLLIVWNDMKLGLHVSLAAFASSDKN